MIDRINPIADAIRPIQPVGVPGTSPTGATFGDLLKQVVTEVAQGQRAAEVAAEQYATGRTTDVASTMITVERANITLQLMLQIRTRLLEAYQEIQRLQV